MKTILEEAKKKYPEITDVDIAESCPSDYGFEDCDYENIEYPHIKCVMTCKECWNRKVNEYEDKTGNPE